MTDEEYNGPVRRPERFHRHPDDEDKTLKLRNILNVIFMLGAIVGVVYYAFADRQTGTYIILGAIVVKIAESAFRILRH